MKARLAKSVYRRLYAGVNYRLRTFAAGSFTARCRPTSIALLMTERCNARCIHCDIWKNRGPEERPTLDQWKPVLSDLRQWLGPVQIVLTGGEALLNRDTLALAAHAGSLGLFVELLSHGYWEDQTKFEAISLAGVSRVTISFDGVGDTHSLIRGREDFAIRTSRTIQTLRQMRQTHSPEMSIRLKTVIMSQNLDDVCNVAWFAKLNGLEVFYQPIEQNYNTPEDSNWFEHSDTWPADSKKAVKVVTQLCELKKQGLPIANTLAQLELMIPYFAAPENSRVAVQSHTAHENQLLCSAMTTLQIQANGDVRACAAKGPIGNIKSQSIRRIWETRPSWWREGCCLEARLPGSSN
ncbi:MAG: radical SAM protein [Pyrinomonadaceae bacterium]